MKIRIDKLDVLFSRFVRLRADNHCEFCGLSKEFGQLQCAHFIGRRYRATRWDTDNAAGLCYTCHNLMHDFATIKKEFFTKRLGSDRVEQLEIQARTYSKPDKDDIKLKLEEKIKGYE